MIAAISTAGAVQTGSVGGGENGANLSTHGGLGGRIAGSGFSDLFRDTIGNVNELEARAQQTVDGLMRGTGVDIHHALIAAEKENAAFELTLSIRNKAIQSYQTVMSMQF